MQNALVIGLGVSGKAAAKFLIAQGMSVQAYDQNSEASKTFGISELKISHQLSSIDFHDIKFAVVSPGIAISHPICQAVIAKGIEILGETELAARYIRQPIVGITGTNGKTTVTMLVAHALNHADIRANAYGNIGEPLCSALLKQEKEVIAAELSSYQLETMQSPCFDAGVILNISPDHLDRYPSMNEYAAAKGRMALCLKPQAKLFVEESCLAQYRHLIPKDDICTYGYSSQCTLSTDTYYLYWKGIKILELPKILQGAQSHNLENFMAAYALCREKGIEPEQFIEAFRTFAKPAHRIEFVRKLNGVYYYDDSKGTNIEAVMRAVASLKGDVFLIAGGVDKGASYKPWIAAFQSKVKHIGAIGQAATKIQKELNPHIPVDCFSTLEEAVKFASKQAYAESYVLLSPGCASFDMFKDYAHRGDEFKRICNAL